LFFRKKRVRVIF